MEPTLTSIQALSDVPQSGYTYVGSQIAALITRFHLEESRALILQTYEDICAGSLAFPHGIRPPDHSRINQDGTPIQYAVTIGSSQPTLQFLGEAGSPAINGVERMRANRQAIATVVQRFHVDKALSTAAPLLDALAPETDVDLLAEPGGAYWIGAAFPGMHTPHLRIYNNARWGKEQDRWTRLSRFAAHFDQSTAWQAVAARLMPDLQPLGTAITFNGDNAPTGRIYLSAYGKRMPFYEELANVTSGASFMNQLRTFGKYMLDSDYIYPTQTAVCSFGFGENPTLDFKFELCAHCLFASDTEAAARLRSWFEAAHLDAADYWDMLAVLSEGSLSTKTTDLHSYVGIGLRRDSLHATIYLKPRLLAP